jgi:4-amino-4-deoxy-L-arabinose transferase-like glycosyltransferase
MQLTHPTQNKLTFPSLTTRVLGVPLPVIALLLITGAGAFLRFYQLGANDNWNAYYAAAIRSMLSSPANFFFVAAEPGGSVTIDKPPLGLWIQAISALIFGINGFAVMLPQALAGVIAIPVLHRIISRRFGVLAGLIAALCLAVTPVTIAAERNNTIDGTLVLTLLLAAWSFLAATETGRLRYLWLGAVLIGLAFNIKMLQAFLPVPAFYGLYLLAGRSTLIRRIAHLGIATVILVAVSLAWVIAVDLTPADQRPYIGSSSNNTVTDLLVGYNGLQRLLGGQRGAGGDGARGMPPVNGGQPPLNAQPNFQPPARATPPQGGRPAGGLSDETGTRGVFRLFSQPLVKEAGWLLPVGLLGVLVIAFRERLKFPLGTAHQALILWGGWLVTAVVFFSMASFFHAYYLIMLGVPLAALVGITLATIWTWITNRSQAALVGIGVLATGIIFQLFTLNSYGSLQGWLIMVAVSAIIALIVIAVGEIAHREPLARFGAIALVGVLFVTPGMWSFRTTLGPISSALPAAWSPNGTAQQPGGNPMMGGGENSEQITQALLTYLQPRTTGQRYMIAVPNSMTGANLVLESGRGVFYIGGFNGMDKILTVEKLAELVKSGQLTYILDSMSQISRSQPELGSWITGNCRSVPGTWGGSMTGTTLYECKA